MSSTISHPYKVQILRWLDTIVNLLSSMFFHSLVLQFIYLFIFLLKKPRCLSSFHSLDLLIMILSCQLTGSSIPYIS